MDPNYSEIVDKELIDKYLQGDQDTIEKISEMGALLKLADIDNKIQIQANNGNKYAQNLLGLLCLDMLHNTNDALEWFKLSAKQDFIGALYNIGIVYRYYLQTYNVEEDENNVKEAFKWWESAADKNDKRAQNMIGICYENGYGVTKNYKKAIEYYKLSAGQNYLLGLHSLVMANVNGIATGQDYIHTYKYCKLANAYVQTLFLHEKIIKQIIITLLPGINKRKGKIQHMEQFIEHLSLYPGSNYKDAEQDFNLLRSVKN